MPPAASAERAGLYHCARDLSATKGASEDGNVPLSGRSVSRNELVPPTALTRLSDESSSPVTRVEVATEFRTLVDGSICEERRGMLTRGTLNQATSDTMHGVGRDGA